MFLSAGISGVYISLWYDKRRQREFSTFSMIFLERFHVISLLPCVCFAGEPETFTVAGYALVDEGLAEWQVLQMLHGIALRVGYPTGTAEVVAVIYEAAGDSRNAAVCRRMHPAAPPAESVSVCHGFSSLLVFEMQRYSFFPNRQNFVVLGNPQRRAAPRRRFGFSGSSRRGYVGRCFAAGRHISNGLINSSQVCGCFDLVRLGAFLFVPIHTHVYFQCLISNTCTNFSA